MATMYGGLGGPAGYGENVFSTSTKAAGSNDDGAVLVDVTSVFSGGINFYGTTYTEIYVNSNGTISFGAPETDYQTSNYTAETVPNLAPFWGDVNINAGGDIYWDLDPSTGSITITWDSVAPYSGSGTNSFQVRLTDLGNGDFEIEYIYEDIQWTGGGGLDVADVGFTDGGVNDVILPGSANASILQDYESYDFGTGNEPGKFSQTFLDGFPQATDGIVSGTAGDDVIDASYVDPGDGDVVDGGDHTGAAGNEDEIRAGDGNDTVSAGAENDLVYGDGGNDTIDGGAGDDVIYGDSNQSLASTGTESLKWSTVAPDDTSVAAGFTQDTGTMDVSVSFTVDGNNLPEFTIETTDTVYVGTGEPFNTNSNLLLFGNGDGATSTTTIDFAANAGSGLEDEVQNVSFRINDIDWGSANHTDIVTVNAYDADGNPVAVSFTLGGGDTLVGNTITAEAVAENFDQLGGSALIEIAGPVASIEIIYANGQGGTQGIWLSDVYFETIATPITGGDDTLTGGLGADTLYGEAGNDTFFVAEGDAADGGGGDDTFYLTDLLEAGSSTITITGGEGGETNGDTLNFGKLIGSINDITYTNLDDTNGGLSGFVTMDDGTVVNFSEIENLIICYVAGTFIETPDGPRKVESLQPGDLVNTKDDGPQPVEWISQKTVLGAGKMAPILFRKGTLGATQDLYVSPQHRMLLSGASVELAFGAAEVFAPAKSLVNGTTVFAAPRHLVTYVHVLLPRHSVIFANGTESESFFPARNSLDALGNAAVERLLRERPDLETSVDQYGPTARPCLTVCEGRLLARMMRPEVARAKERALA